MNKLPVKWSLEISFRDIENFKKLLSFLIETDHQVYEYCVYPQNHDDKGNLRPMIIIESSWSGNLFTISQFMDGNFNEEDTVVHE
jgi:hypothetical protein